MNISEMYDEILVASHSEFINNIYKCTIVNGECLKYLLHPKLFNVSKPFKRKNQCKNDFISEEALNIRQRFDQVRRRFLLHFKPVLESNETKTLLPDINKFSSSEKIKGGNNSNNSLIAEIKEEPYLIPPNCKFFNFDVKEITTHVSETFDLIVLDPPWWNKYIRRKRSKSPGDGYSMMWNKELAEIQIEKLLEKDGLIAVWCTNSSSHINALKEIIFPSWGVIFLAQWFWLKVTINGEIVTPFSPVNGKQPYERILFAAKDRNRKYPLLPNDRIIVSVPCILHSHKPPLADLLQSFVPSQYKGLEIFARNLLPGWTSYGNEVLKLQHTSLFQRENITER